MDILIGGNGIDEFAALDGDGLDTLIGGDGEALDNYSWDGDYIYIYNSVQRGSGTDSGDWPT